MQYGYDVKEYTNICVLSQPALRADRRERLDRTPCGLYDFAPPARNIRTVTMKTC